MNTPILDGIHCPDDIKKLDKRELVPLCTEIRGFLLDSVSKTGGHLASNLGLIELTVALHRAMNLPQDVLLFDVGHQCYTHKLLTGRKDGFAKLRQLDGISGFPNPAESEYDAFVSGHGNTALSVAIGMAYAKKLSGEEGQVIAVIGDGAFTGGMVYEGINNIDDLDNLIVILNDNKMSISANVGSMARYLTVLRTEPVYVRTKQRVQSVLESIPLVGIPTRNILQDSKQLIRRRIYHSTLFEEMGFQYVGPVDGHDVAYLTDLLDNLKTHTGPLFLHVVTKKGKGYGPAEKNPDEFHGVSSFIPDGLDPDRAPKESFSNVFGQTLVSVAKSDNKICAVTAAMQNGTGLDAFAKEIPGRFFDVGMAEQHAVTFSAGLAAKGYYPVACIYSTFLQRSFDQLIHDVSLMQLPVLLAIDRAGLIPGDGETHQGVYDPAFLSQIGIETWSPVNYAQLTGILQRLAGHITKPTAVRYPRGKEQPVLSGLPDAEKCLLLVSGDGQADTAIVSYGAELEEALKAGQMLNAEGKTADVYQLYRIFPLDESVFECLKQYRRLLFAEECVKTGGIGEHLLMLLTQNGWNGKFIHCAVDVKKLTHAAVNQLRELQKLDAASLVRAIKEL